MSKVISLSLLLIFACHLTAQVEESDTLRLLFAGDIMGHGPQIQSAQQLSSGRYDFNEGFRYIQPVLESADLAVANLELTLPGEPPYLGYPMFRSPDALAEALRNSGFDLLLTANNHSNDGGREGLIRTIGTLHENGFYQTGTFKDGNDKALLYPLIIYKKGFKIAMLNYTYGTNLNRTRPPTVVNMLDLSAIRTDLRTARQMRADAIIVVMHWGDEYSEQQNKQQEAMAQQLFRWGADLIIGSHPHVVQPVQRFQYQEAQRIKEVAVAYSLGNFISNQQRELTDGGILLEATFIKNQKDESTRLGDVNYIPVWRFVKRRHKQKSVFYCLPVALFEGQHSDELNIPAGDQQKLEAYGSYIRAHLQGSGCKERVPVLNLQNVEK